MLNQKINEDPDFCRQIVLLGIDGIDIRSRQFEFLKNSFESSVPKKSGGIPFRPHQDAVTIQRPIQDNLPVIAAHRSTNFDGL